MTDTIDAGQASRRTLPAVVAAALVQGVLLHWLHLLVDDVASAWSELSFLLPTYTCTVAVPLSYYLLRARLGGRRLMRALLFVAIFLGATALHVGWINGPVGDLYPSAVGSVLLYLVLASLAWFIALPFLTLGLRGGATADGYAALFDEAWRLAITLTFAGLFTLVFWALLSLFVALFAGIGIYWPGTLIWRAGFVYPATCASVSFAIGLTDVQPEMFSALRRLLLTVLRWLTVVAAAIILAFLGTLVVEGVGVLWGTRVASWGLIGMSLVLITLYNTVYQDGREVGDLPIALAWPVRAAMVVGPALTVLAFRAVALRMGQYGVSEDRLLALVVVTMLTGYLVGYSIIAIGGARAPFTVRHVNITMALTIVTTLISVHSPILDFKRIATRAQLHRVPSGDDKFDFGYLRKDLGRHGIVALRGLAESNSEHVAAMARRALAEAVPRWNFFGERVKTDRSVDRERFTARFEVYPDGVGLEDDLIDMLLRSYEENRWQLACVDRDAPCLALIVDLDRDGQDEVVVPFDSQGTVYAREASGWKVVGQLQRSSCHPAESLRPGLRDGVIQPLPPSTYGGLRIDKDIEFVFTPTGSQEHQCLPGS